MSWNLIVIAVNYPMNSKKKKKIGPMNSNENVYKKGTEMESFLPGNLNSNKVKIRINNEFLSPHPHALTVV